MAQKNTSFVDRSKKSSPATANKTTPSHTNPVRRGSNNLSKATASTNSMRPLHKMPTTMMTTKKEGIVSRLPSNFVRLSTKTSKIASTTTTDSSPQQRTVENFLLVWLDSAITVKNNDNQHSIAQLRRLVNSIKLFTDPNMCADFILSIADDKILLIVSGALGEEITSLLHDYYQLDSIYVFCSNKAKHEQWAKSYSKVKGVFTDIKSICECLKNATQQANQNTAPFSILCSSNQTFSNEVDLNSMEPSFMYSQLLKETFLDIDYDTEAKKEMVIFCREQYAENDEELHVIEEFNRDYENHSPAWWYTRHCFLYKMLNKAFRTLDIEILCKMGFFIRDLHQQLEKLQTASATHGNLILYRGQGMLNEEFEKLKGSQGGLISFHSFLSTSASEDVSLNFARESLDNIDLAAILFELHVDSSLRSSPFASLHKISYFPSEKEILFSTHTVFRINSVRQMENGIWNVVLKQTSDDDPELHCLTEYMRGELQGKGGWHRLGFLMLRMNEWKKAQEIFEMLIERATDNDNNEDLCFLHHNLGMILGVQGKTKESFSHFEKAVSFRKPKIQSGSDDEFSVQTESDEEEKQRLAVGTFFRNQQEMMDNYEQGCKQSIRNCQLEIDILLGASKPDYQMVANSYLNIATLYCQQGRFNNAQQNLEQAVKSQLEYLPQTHPNLALTYIQLANVCDAQKDYSTALNYAQTALRINKRSLPAQHINIAIAHRSVSCGLLKTKNIKEAFKHAEQAVEIANHALPPDHPERKAYQDTLDLFYWFGAVPDKQ